MKATCPKNPKHDRFFTVATTLEEWVVDREGSFLELHVGIGTVHGPDPDKLWTCADCGAEAKVE